MANRNDRNFGNGKTLNAFTNRNLSRETATMANRGDALALKTQSALKDLGGHLRERFGIRYIEKVEMHHLESWAGSLADRLAEDTISSSTTSSYVSAVNTMFATHDRSDLNISAKAFDIARGAKFSNVNLANSQESQAAFKSFCQARYIETGDVRYQALKHSVTIQVEAGLRFRESTQIKIAGKDLSGNQLHLVKGDGVKNGQPRSFEPQRMDGLHAAQRFVDEQRRVFGKGSLIPSGSTYKAFKCWAYDQVEAFRKENPAHASYHYHGNRHRFSHREYSKAWAKRTGVAIKPPVVSGLYGKDHNEDTARRTGLNQKETAELNKIINLDVAEKLGHHREESGHAYSGK
jgi:hypothetical protein